MAKQKKQVSEGVFDLRLTLPDDIELSPEDVDVSVVGAEGEEMGGEEELSMEEPMDDMGGEEEMSAELPPEEGEEEIEEMDMYESDEECPEDEEVMESKRSSVDSIFENLSDDDVIEIDENMLRRELARLQEGGATDPKVLDDFGGGKAVMEPFVDADDDDLNVHAEDTGEAPKSEARVVSMLKRELASLKKENKQYKVVVNKLRTQLTETNLFNAKLLYANKLMQNKTISNKQKIAVVEALDKAQTLREAKLVFNSLVKSLGISSGKQMSESKKPAPQKGSVSKVVKSSGTSQENLLTEDVETSNRWAKLAGILKG